MSEREPAALHAVGIDLGTTYSCLSYLTPQGQPVSCPNSEGEMTTPSVVLFDGDEVIVGTEALRNAVAQPERVVQHAKRFMADPQKCWVMDGHVYTPVDISAFIIGKLLIGAEERLNSKIRHAVITVPAQFSDFQRQRTVEAGLKAGLERVDVINEPVAAALCYVLGEGMWFAELAEDQTVMVFDLGGGTFDLSLVRYNKDRVTVLASGGDLHLGGLDWNQKIEEWACQQFVGETPLEDPRIDRESMQALSIDVEQAKRALSVRPRATVTVQHAGRRKSFAIDRDYFEVLTRPLVQRTRTITEQMLRTHKLEIEGRTDSKERHTGWAHVNAVLATGGASRMPMVRTMLQEISGRTLNSTLSPDQSISHGAAYYAGILLSGQKLTKSVLNKQTSARLARFKQQSVNARGLGILVRDKDTGRRLPHYLIPPNTPLPVAARQKFGTVAPGQTRVNLRIIESGANPEDPYVDLGECQVEGLPKDLPAETPIEVTIRYDEQARVHVSAIEPSSGRAAKTTIVREENVKLLPREAGTADVQPIDAPAIVNVPTKKASRPAAAAPAPPPAAPAPRPAEAPKPVRPNAGTANAPRTPVKAAQKALEEADRPVPLCNTCGEPFDARGRCPSCGALLGRSTPMPKAAGPQVTFKPTPPKGVPVVSPKSSTPPALQPPPRRKSQKPEMPETLEDTEQMQSPPKSSARPKLRGQKTPPPVDDGESEFWNSFQS